MPAVRRRAPRLTFALSPYIPYSMTDTPIPDTPAQEKAQHGFFWRINTVKGFFYYDVLFSGLLLPYLLYFNHEPAYRILQCALACLPLLFGLWFFMLLPGAMLRTAIGKRGGVLAGCLASLCGMVMLAVLSAGYGLASAGPVMLFIFLAGPYKVVRSHFGLRALGIPLSLPEWREPALAPDRAKMPRHGFSFNLFFRLLYGLCVFALFSCTLTFCFYSRYTYHYGYGCLFALLVLLPAFHLGKICLNTWENARDTYLRDQPAKSLCYALIGIIVCLAWSALAFGLMRLFTAHTAPWVLDGGQGFTATLAAVLAAMGLLVLFRFLCARNPRPQEPAEDAPSAHVPLTYSRPVPRFSARQAYGWLLLLLPLLIAALGYPYMKKIRRHPSPYSHTTLQWQNRPAYHESLRECRMP